MRSTGIDSEKCLDKLMLTLYSLSVGALNTLDEMLFRIVIFEVKISFISSFKYPKVPIRSMFHK